MSTSPTQAALAEIAAEVRACTRCGLHRGRTQAVPGEGNPLSDVLLVGEGPGAREDATGRPFVGPAGQLLNELLQSIGWAREDVFIANVV
jgi:DNA polymerase